MTYFGVHNVESGAGIKSKCYHVRFFIEYQLFEKAALSSKDVGLGQLPWEGGVPTDYGVYSYGVSEGHGAYLADPSVIDGVKPVFGPHKIRVHLHGNCCDKPALEWYTVPERNKAGAKRPDGHGGYEEPGPIESKPSEEQRSNDESPGYLPPGF